MAYFIILHGEMIMWQVCDGGKYIDRLSRVIRVVETYLSRSLRTYMRACMQMDRHRTHVPIRNVYVCDVSDDVYDKLD